MCMCVCVLLFIAVVLKMAAMHALTACLLAVTFTCIFAFVSVYSNIFSYFSCYNMTKPLSFICVRACMCVCLTVSHTLRFVASKLFVILYHIIIVDIYLPFQTFAVALIAFSSYAQSKLLSTYSYSYVDLLCYIIYGITYML